LDQSHRSRRKEAVRGDSKTCRRQPPGAAATPASTEREVSERKGILNAANGWKTNEAC